ncbi:outer membrane lipoprotein, partial [Haemophilus influenzae]
NQRREKSN